MEIQLQTLILQNFMGGSFVLSADCEDVNVYGQNGSGKTRLASAISWLLFDKDSMGRSSFEIKNLDARGEQEHGLEHSVEGVFCIDGHQVSLKKIYKEIWTKKRGNAKAVFSGNTTDYYLDDVPVQKKEYVERVTELAGDESAFRLLTSPTVFPSMHWTKQRALLLDVVGNISDIQVIESDASLQPLIVLLERYKSSKKPFDDLKAVIVARRKEINEKLEQIPVRIDETRRALPSIEGLNKKEIETEVAALEQELSNTKAKLHGIDNGADIAELSKKLATVKADILKFEQDHYNGHMAIANRIAQEIRDLNNQKADAERRERSIKADIEAKQSRLTGLESQLQALRDRWTVINAEAFQDTTNDTCPACGQALPYDRVEEARANALGEFNQKKAERLTEIETKGKALASEKDRITLELADLDPAQYPTATYDEEIENKTILLNNTKKLADDYTFVKGRDELLIEKAAIEKDIEKAKGSVAVGREAVSAKVVTLTNQLAEAKAKADLFPKRFQGEKRIAELKDEETELGHSFEEAEKQLYLCEQFIKTKVSLLTDRINEKFELVKFKLFNVLVNGGIEECCMMTINGVPYEGGLNNAARIQGGLDIIRTLQEHFKLQAPIIIDNRESVTDIPNVGCQVISLVVSPEDKDLRVEKAAEKKRAA